MAVGEKFALSCGGCGVGSPAGLRAGAAGAERRDRLSRAPGMGAGRGPSHRQRAEGAVGRLSVQAGPGAACAGTLGMGTHCTAAGLETDVFLSPSLCTATLLPGPLCSPCLCPSGSCWKGCLWSPL